MRGISAVKLALVLLLATALHGQRVGVDVQADSKAGTGFRTKWDYRAGGLLLYRNVDVPSAVAVRLVSDDGSTVPIRPLADLPGAQEVSVWDVAKTPDGGAVISVIVRYTGKEVKPRVLKSLLLTYNKGGQLTKLWNVYPYHFHHLAVAGDGAVFGLGTKDTTRRDYPLLVKYSSSGTVLGEFLPAGQFAVGDAVVESGSPNGETQMFVTDDELVLWFAPTEEVVRVSLAGDLRARHSFQKLLSGLALRSGSSRVRVLQLSPNPTGGFTAQIQLWPQPNSNDRSVRLAMAVLARDGSNAQLSAPGDQRAQKARRFLGETRDGQGVFHTESSESGIVIEKQDVN